MKSKKGEIITAVIIAKIVILFVLVLIEISSLLTAYYKIERGATLALESALKEIVVTADNQVMINKSAAASTFSEYFSDNLNLNADYSPSEENNYINSVVIEEFFFYDLDTTGLPYKENSETFYYPTVHLRFRVNIKTFANGFGLPAVFTKEFHLDESNESIKGE